MRYVSTLALTLALFTLPFAHADELDESWRERVEQSFQRSDELQQQAGTIEAIYRAGERELADRAVVVHSLMTPWNDVNGRAEVSARFRAGALELTVRRLQGAGSGPLAVVFAPGIYCAPVWNASNPPQPLVLLEAPVVVLDTCEQIVTHRVRVACAQLGADDPREGQRYTLHAQGRGSALEGLLREACTREPSDEPAVQLALWALRNGLTPDVLKAKTYRTFGGQPVTPDQGCDAKALLIAAGVEPKALPYFAQGS